MDMTSEMYRTTFIGLYGTTTIISYQVESICECRYVRSTRVIINRLVCHDRAPLSHITLSFGLHNIVYSFTGEFKDSKLLIDFL